MAHDPALEMARAKDLLASGHPSSIEHHATTTYAEPREALVAHLSANATALEK